MTSHAPAIPRLRIDIAEWLRARRKQKRPEPEDIWLHLHDRPIVIMKTTAGDFPAQLMSACLYDGQMTCNFVFTPPADLAVLSVIQRHGRHEAVIPIHEVTEINGKLECHAGVEMRLHVSFQFGMAALVVEALAPPDDA